MSIPTPSPELIETAAGTFAYLGAGAPNAPVVLCLHGFPDHPPSFRPLMQRLAGAGFRAVAPWMRGYAPSPLHGPYHVDQLGEDAIALATALSPHAPVEIIGHDWGAAATYSAIALAPQRFRAAVTMAVPHPLAFARNLARQPAQLRRSWYMLFFQLARLPERVVPRDDFAFIERLWRAWSPGLRVEPADMAALKRCLAASMPAPIEYYRALARPLRDAAERVRAGAQRRITTPTLHLQGADDGCIAPSAGAGQQRFFDGPFRSEVVEGAGHFLQLEAPDRVADAALAWFTTR